MMSSADGRDMSVGASYLREQAQRCVRLARECPHVPTSHELEVISLDLMKKAAELDELLTILPASTGGDTGKGKGAELKMSIHRCKEGSV